MSPWVGLGAPSDQDIQGVLAGAYGNVNTPPNVQGAINQYASNGALSGVAQAAMGSFAAGGTPDMSGMLASAAAKMGAAGEASLGLPPALTVALGVVTVALPVLAPITGGLAAAAALLTNLLPAASGVQGQSNCTTGGWISDIPMGTPIPWGPGDSRWKPFPYKPGNVTCPPQCPPDARDSCYLDSGFVVQTYCEYLAAAPGSFEQFCLAALLADYELGDNCQPTFVDPQHLVIACIIEWNAAHPSSSADYTIHPIEQQTPGWGAPVAIIPGLLGGIYSPPPAMAQPDQPIHMGPLTPVLDISGKGIDQVLQGLPKKAPTTSTGTTVAVATAGVAGAAALTIGIVAIAKGWAFGKAADWIWKETGAKAWKSLKAHL